MKKVNNNYIIIITDFHFSIAGTILIYNKI